MDLPGSVAMERWGRLFRSRPWHELRPDSDHVVVTGGVGEYWGNDYLSAAVAPDGSTLMAYMPTARTVTVEMAKLAKAGMTAWWFNPRSGEATAAGAVSASGAHAFTPIPGNLYASFPQGIELLFLPAVALGGNSPAAMVHFLFLLDLAVLMAC